MTTEMTNLKLREQAESVLDFWAAQMALHGGGADGAKALRVLEAAVTAGGSLPAALDALHADALIEDAARQAPAVDNRAEIGAPRTQQFHQLFKITRSWAKALDILHGRALADDVVREAAAITPDPKDTTVEQARAFARDLQEGRHNARAIDRMARAMTARVIEQRRAAAGRATVEQDAPKVADRVPVLRDHAEDLSDVLRRHLAEQDVERDRRYLRHLGYRAEDARPAWI